MMKTVAGALAQVYEAAIDGPAAADHAKAPYVCDMVGVPGPLPVAEAGLRQMQRPEDAHRPAVARRPTEARVEHGN